MGHCLTFQVLVRTSPSTCLAASLKACQRLTRTADETTTHEWGLAAGDEHFEAECGRS